MIAAITPINPPKTPKILKKPPLMLGESDNKTPSKPNTTATPAHINPKKAPVANVRMAAIIEIIDGILNAAFFVMMDHRLHFHKFNQSFLKN